MSTSGSSPLLVLIGFMGAGKSTQGRLLSEALGCRFVDLDVEIERVHGAIPELFSSRGESGFRAIEHLQLYSLLPRLGRPAVLSLGGGAYVQPANRELLIQHGATIVHLDAPFEILCARVRGTGNQRPLARDLDRLAALYAERRPIYQRADYTLDASSSDPAPLLTALVQLASQLGASLPGSGTL